MRTLVWFRGKDLRLGDHAPLHDALEHGEIVPLFVLDPYFFSLERARALPHRMQFLLESLVELEAAIAARGSKLLVVAGKSTSVVPRIARQCRVERVVAQRWSEPFGRERDRRIAEALDVPFVLFEGETLHAPGTLRTRAGTPYGVFTPFSRAFAAEARIAAPFPAPARLPALPRGVTLETVAVPTCEELGIRRNPALMAGGETRAHERLARFVRGPARAYHETRDRLDMTGSSRLSQDLKFGTLSPRTVWQTTTRALDGSAPDALRAFRNELVWREFTHSTLFDYPHVLTEPFRETWQEFPWRSDAASYDAWVSGTTGYPIVDAAARQLVAEGFVPNRARMVAASFLTKHLLLDYRRGEAHYLALLTDGDWAQNNAGWQWTAGSGTDAQPFFRIFDPVAQGQKFDPTGAYVRRWLPELARLPTEHVHAPLRAPESALEAAGIRLGKDYPLPIVDHATARARYLAVAKSHFARSRQERYR